MTERIIVQHSLTDGWDITGPTCRLVPRDAWCGEPNDFWFVKTHHPECRAIQGCSEETGHVFEVVAVFVSEEQARQFATAYMEHY